MSVLSRIHAARPWQLLALFVSAMTLGLLLFLNMPADLDHLPGPQAKLIQAHWRTWLILWFAAIGLVVDMVVFYRSRPGSAPDLVERNRRELRRAIVMSLFALAGGLAL